MNYLRHLSFVIQTWSKQWNRLPWSKQLRPPWCFIVQMYKFVYHALKAHDCAKGYKNCSTPHCYRRVYTTIYYGELFALLSSRFMNWSLKILRLLLHGKFSISFLWRRANRWKWRYWHASDSYIGVEKYFFNIWHGFMRS